MWDIFKNFLPSLIQGAATAYTAYQTNQAYKDQQDAADMQRQVAQEQLTQAGLIEQQAVSQEAAAREANQLAELNAVDAEVQNARQQDNLRAEQAVSEADSRARAAASGVTASGSIGATLSEQERVNQESLGWLQKTGASAASAIRTGGNVAMAQGMAQAKGTIASAAGVRAGAAGTMAGASQTDAGASKTLASGVSQTYRGGKSAWSEFSAAANKAGWF